MTSSDTWHQPLLQQWQQCLTQQKIPHAILLHGQPGLGKQQLVKSMLQLLWCETHQACGACRHCHWLQQNTHPDCLWLQPEAPGKAIKIDDIREATQWLQLSPLHSQKKVLVIQAAENLNIASSNALLKSLEEPPDSGFIILISEIPEQLLLTIRSRCQKWRIPMPEKNTLTSWLQTKTGLKKVAEDLLEMGLGPYALLQEFSPEQTEMREKITEVFVAVSERKIYFITAAEKLKEYSPQEILRYFSYFLQAKIMAAAKDNAIEPLKKWLDVQQQSLVLKRSILQNANLNFPLQLELLLQNILKS